MVKISICSFSFHRLLDAGKQDIFQYISDCKELGCTHLQPWNAHFARNTEAGGVVHLGSNPGESGSPLWLEAPKDGKYLQEIEQAAEESGLPFELIAVDRAYIYDDDASIRTENRRRAYEWLDVAEILGAEGIRVDAG